MKGITAVKPDIARDMHTVTEVNVRLGQRRRCARRRYQFCADCQSEHLVPMERMGMRTCSPSAVP